MPKHAQLDFEDIAIEVLERNGRTAVTYGDYTLLHEIAEAAGITCGGVHKDGSMMPSSQITINVLNALDRHCKKRWSKFVKTLIDSRRPYRCFTIKDKYEPVQRVSYLC